MQIQAVQSHNRTLAMWFLGTCSAPVASRAHGPSLVLRVGNDIWFFDCADDTQRQLQRVATGGSETGVKYLKAARVFVTSLDGPRIFGLPGLLCSLVCPL
jgi:ribonuclease BN (tRNA processing enzyme)